MNNVQPSNKSKRVWPELQPARTAVTLEQALALEKVRLQAENANKLLIKRSKPLLCAIVIGLISVLISSFNIVPMLLRGHIGGPALLTMLGMLLQLSTAAYFLRAKDSITASQIIRLLLILNGLILVLGLSLLGIPIFSVVTLILLSAAYQSIERLKAEDRE